MAAEKPKCIMTETHRNNGKIVATFTKDAKTCFFREGVNCRAMSGTGQTQKCPLGFKRDWER